MMSAPENPLPTKNRFDPRWAGLAAFLLVCAGLGGPGITIDEPLDVAPGRHYWESLVRLQGAFFGPEGVRNTFGGNPDHPPLARWILGAFSKSLDPVRLLWTGAPDPTGLNIVGARAASAAAFGITVALLGHFVRKRHGYHAGWAAAISYSFLPHVFGHAHLAALETILNLFWLISILSWIRWFEKTSMKRALWAGAMTGMVCSTKIQGWLTFPWIMAVLMSPRFSWRERFFGVIAAFTVPLWWFASWPWMWYESATRLKGYFLSSVERTHLNVLYFGQVYQDDRLPWHYSLLQWYAAVPPIVLVLAIIGFLKVAKRPLKGADFLLALIPCGILLLFSLPITRYDMDRLFLVQWSSVAVLAGIGFEQVRHSRVFVRWPLWSLRILAVVLTISLSYPCLKLSPLSYVSPLAGGLKSFETWGMDTNYWGDAVDSTLMRSFEREAKPGQKIVVVPTLAVGQAAFLTPPSLLKKGIMFEEQGKWREADWIIVYRRPTYWPEGFSDWFASQRPILTRQRDGVWLAGVWCGPKGSCASQE